MLTGPASTIAIARKLRRKLTLPEGLLWRELRKRPSGHKFRRQHPAGSYVLDFVCMQARLAIEVDGESHNLGSNSERDQKRDAWLLKQGYRTLRIAARDVLGNLDGVITVIVEACQPLHQVALGSPPRTGEEF